MYKSALLTLIFAVLGLCGSAQEIDITSNLEIQAKEMIQAIVTEDYESYAKYSYPPIIKMYGGKDAMIEMTQANKTSQKEGGMVIKSADFSSSLAPVVSDSTTQSIVAFDYIMEISGNKYKGTHYLLAISENEGADWTFVELETFDAASIKDFVPLYSDELSFPEIKGAVYVTDK